MDESCVVIDTKHLANGMYVVELDRPWLETPFVFQGFEISDKAEIDILKKYCKRVCIDTDRGSLTSAQTKALQAAQLPGEMRTLKSGRAEARPGRLRTWLRDLLLRYDIAWLRPLVHDESKRYPIESTVRREADDVLEVVRHRAHRSGATFRSRADRTPMAPCRSGGGGYPAEPWTVHADCTRIAGGDRPR